MSVEKINPPEVAPPVAFYSHLAVVPSGHKLLVLGVAGREWDACQIAHGLEREIGMFVAQRRRESPRAIDCHRPRFILRGR